MEANHLIKEYPNNPRCIRGFGTWDEMGHFGKPVYHYKNEIMLSLGFGKTKDKVHTHVLPRTVEDWERGVKSSVLLDLFSRSTSSALAHNSSNIPFQTRPKELLLHESDGFVDSEVSNQSFSM